jgi:hypothetical protein
MIVKKTFPWWLIVLAVAGICALCTAVVLIAGIFFSFTRSTSPSNPIVALNTLPPVSTFPASPTSFPVIPEPTNAINPEPTSSGLTLTGNQQLRDFYLYDDFSSEALDWPVYDDGVTIIKYENGQYSFQIAEPDTYDWAYVPLDFSPTDIWFDVQGMNGPQDGTMGVFCQFQDDDNYYYVEFDLGTRSFIIGQYIAGVDTILSQENAQGDVWQPTSALKPSPQEVNRIGITCNLDSIILFINDEWVTEVSVGTPAATSGEMALFVFAYSYGSGYRVFFDNVEVYKPMQ